MKSRKTIKKMFSRMWVVSAKRTNASGCLFLPFFVVDGKTLVGIVCDVLNFLVSFRNLKLNRRDCNNWGFDFSVLIAS